MATLMQMAAPFLQGLQQQQQQQQPNGPAVQPFDPSTLMQMAVPFLQGLQQQQQQQQQQNPATPTVPFSGKTEPTALMEQDAPAAPKDSELSVEETPPAEPAPGGSPVFVPSTPVDTEAVKLHIELPEATRLKLVQLQDMGFFDEASNLAALEKGDGRVEKALDILFQTM